MTITSADPRRSTGSRICLPVPIFRLPSHSAASLITSMRPISRHGVPTTPRNPDQRSCLCSCSRGIHVLPANIPLASAQHPHTRAHLSLSSARSRNTLPQTFTSPISALFASHGPGAKLVHGTGIGRKVSCAQPDTVAGRAFCRCCGACASARRCTMWSRSQTGRSRAPPRRADCSVLVAATAATLVFIQRDDLTLTAIGFAWANGLIGFADDFIKVRMRRPLGVCARTKLALGIATGLALALLALGPLNVGTPAAAKLQLVTTPRREQRGFGRTIRLCVRGTTGCRSSKQFRPRAMANPPMKSSRSTTRKHIPKAGDPSRPRHTYD
jgi:hypothetical protein